MRNRVAFIISVQDQKNCDKKPTERRHFNKMFEKILNKNTKYKILFR